MSFIIIIDYSMGNLRSIEKRLKKLGVNSLITSNITEIEKADKLILPGVGHFKAAMEKIRQMNLLAILNRKVLKDKVPILGICLGTQLFCRFSEEGNAEGLGWIDAEAIRFRVSDKIKYKVPHMGWNQVKVVNFNSLDRGIRETDEFYFVHSYHLKCNDPKDIWMTTVYDYEFVSAIHRDNIYGTQFHPEKSHDAGMEVLKNFCDL
ncbi:imidazole glycerol phosphate synthase subunit HisH [Melioribacter roseus P3M-2]|uniref:Imidazole glycerol phosphate synthase subunit HisH n=1 Tax=Melioribacter roseus (strain DSM 23840 / JCM 17771 / VKM B-2668 / P3M-2) TaxID=1191523 RepID=I6YZD2_MELRP|nr:imidazole glycerol phosphate synthase subunit HisH [Melioribacter roseus]AFN75907.1 imidazole glycerol phosphate synthase subunit HisH [Melioribacter roseus P3M-2]